MQNHAKERKNIDAKLQQESSYGAYTFSDAAQLWMQSQEKYWKVTTYATYYQLLTKHVLPYWEDIKISSIKNQTMEEFISYLMINSCQKNPSVNYLAQICALVRRILIYFNTRYDNTSFVPINPITKGNFHPMLLPGENTLLTLEQYLLEHCEKDTCLGILIAFHTGIRLGELSALTWKEIYIEEELIYIRKNLLRVESHKIEQAENTSKTCIVKQEPKTSDSIRIIPIPPKLLPILKKYKKEDSLYVISGAKNPWAEPRTIQYRFKSILKKCQLEYFNFHMLRHAFATRCVAMGLDVKSLSEILGHSNIQITLNLYVHPTIQQKKHLMAQYDLLFQNRS